MLYHTTDRGNKLTHTWKRAKRQRESRETACCDSYSLHYFWFWVAILPVKKAKANQYCHSQLQIKLSLFLLPPCSFLGHSICRNSDKPISIDCWWDQGELTSGVFCFFFLPPSLCFFLQNGQGVKQWSKTHKKTAVINKHNKTLI